jgi:four helix bundle protein
LRGKQHRGGAGSIFTERIYHFLSQARGSLVEIETQLLIAGQLSYLQPAKVDSLLNLANELGNILNGLMASTKIPAAQPASRSY